VRIADGGAHFEGTLYRPRQAEAEADRQMPAVLILHGSGPMQRRAYHDIAHRFATRGFVVLNVDKRGVGGSSGSYYGDDLGRDSVIERRARDARVALQFLSRVSGVDSARVGVVAVSQGGWIVPLLLGGDTPATFAVNLSGAAVSSREEGAWSEWAGESEDHFGLKPPPEPFDTLDARLRSVAAGPFDPRPYLKQMRLPSLWLFGEWDSSLPTKASVRVLDSLRAQGVDVSVRVFPEANHGLMVVRGPNGRRLANYAPGVWDTVFSWLSRQPHE
jgi:dienelactone hydrolase